MTNEFNKALDNRLTLAQNSGDFSEIDQLLAADFVGHFVGFPTVQGREGWKQIETFAHTVFPDFQLAIQDQIAEGDKVVSRWVATGTHRGSLNGETPTGKSVSFVGVRIIRIADGQIVEEWDQADQLSLMQQIGLLPGS